MKYKITIGEAAAVTASRKAVKISLLAAAMLTSALAPSFAQAPSTDLPKVFSDGVGAKTQRVKNINQVRYIEMYLAARDPKTGDFLGACYNSSILPSDIPASKDTSPQNLLEGLNFKNIKKEFGVAAASLNGPKLWMCDWFEADVGVTRVFNGIKAQWCAQTEHGQGHQRQQSACLQTIPYRAEELRRLE